MDELNRIDLLVLSKKRMERIEAELRRIKRLGYANSKVIEILDKMESLNSGRGELVYREDEGQKQCEIVISVRDGKALAAFASEGLAAILKTLKCAVDALLFEPSLLDCSDAVLADEKEKSWKKLF